MEFSVSDTLLTATDNTATVVDVQTDAPASAASDVAKSATAPGEQATDQKDETATDGTAEDQASEASKEVPEDYGEFTLPEGVQPDEEALGEFKNLAKDLALTKDQAQQLVDLQVKLTQKGAEVQKAAWAKHIEGWVGEVKTDAEIGGAEMPQKLAVAKTFIERFGDDQLRKDLDAYGIGNMPSLVRAFYRAGKAISEDKFVSGQAVQPPKDPLNVLYPTMT
jgi:hypothetical protein